MSYADVSLELFRLTGGFAAVLDAGGMAGPPGGLARHAIFRTRCLLKDLSETAGSPPVS